MKKILLLFFLISCACGCFAAKKIDGYIIMRNNKMINVTFLVPFKFLSSEPDYVRLQYRVRYVVNNEKLVLKPDDAKELVFTIKGEKIRMLSVYDNVSGGRLLSSGSQIFLKLEKDGAVKIFSYFQTSSSPGFYNPSTGMSTGGTTYTTERMVLQKGDGELFRPRGLAFKKDVAAYFADCPELVDKIEEKQFRKSDLEAIVMYYNQHCGE